MEDSGQQQPPSHDTPAIPAWTLTAGHIHVWLWQVSSAPLRDGAMATLDSRERRRAERFRPQPHRARWVRAHVGMRRILAGYLDREPGAVVFERGPHGKPRLQGENTLRFNLSHSQDWCALAVARQMEIGLDIQLPHPVRPRLWQRVLTPRELSEIASISPGEQEAAFFRCWTRKEAIGKADSRGVYVHLKRTETGLAPRTPASTAPAVILVPDNSGATTPWHLSDLALPAGLFGALASSQPATPALRAPEPAGLQLE